VVKNSHSEENAVENWSNTADCPALLEENGPVGVICTVPDGPYRPPACFKRSQKYSQTIAQILERKILLKAKKKLLKAKKNY
jgi:hypothetical protein